MPVTTDGLSRIFAALADPTRRDILSRLETGPLSVTELAAPYSMSRPAVSQHVTVLEEAGLITRSAAAQYRPCHLRPEGMDEASAWIAQHSAAWERRFEKLDQHLRRTAPDEESNA
jgi:DNA-binding transcriptional ArsR family regulator